MKYNKFLIILILSMVISTNVGITLNASDSWRNLGYNTLMRTPNHIYKVGKIMTAYTFSTMSSWSTNKILSVVSIGIILLVAIFGREKVKKWWNNDITHVPEQNSPANPAFQQKIIVTKKDESINPTQESDFTDLLKKNNYSVDYIFNLQITYQDDKPIKKELNKALIKHYKEEYINDINALLDKSKENINRFIQQKKENCDPKDPSGKEPQLMRQLGTNIGPQGLRIKALNSLQTDLDK